MPKLYPHFSKVKILFFVFIFSFIYTSKINAQCAGSDSSVDICDKEMDPAYQAYDLFTQLSGTPSTGGTWESNDPLNNDILNGSLINLWELSRSGSHAFTYTNNSCNESATVTVNLGGYPGEDNTDGNAHACDTDSAVNLFSFISNNTPNINPDINGLWEAVSANAEGFVVNFNFLASAAGEGVYTLQYTVPSVGSCPDETSTVVLEVHEAPEAGEDSPINLCETDDLSIYTNVNLRNQLSGEDNNGIWTDDNATGQITSVFDSLIDIQQIYTDFGPGTYEFSYHVQPDHGVCEEDVATVVVFIEEELTLSGTANITSTCVDLPITINFNYDQSLLPGNLYSEEYIVTYELYDENDLLINTLEAIDVTIINGSFTLPIPPQAESGIYSAAITSVVNEELTEYCDIQVDISSESFVIFDPVITIDDICLGEDANVLLQNILNETGNPSNETYTITYALTDPLTNTTNISTDPITFNNGEGSFVIDASLLQTTENEGLYAIHILQPSFLNVPCMGSSFTVRPIPGDIDLQMVVDNQCDATKIEVIVNAPNLSSGEYNITYEVTETNNTEVLIDNTIIFTGGNANYIIDISTLEAGNYEVVLRSTQTDTNPCRTDFEFEVIETFSIDGLPDPPELDPSQSFCFTNYMPTGPTISDITVDSGENLVWYEDMASSTPLDPSTVLVDGEDYYVTSTSASNSCQSSERAAVVVFVISTGLVSTLDENPVFCGSDNATVANLNASTGGGQLTWYDSATGGNVLNPTTPLIDGNSYYAVEAVSGCESAVRLQVNVTVVDPPVPTLTGDNLFCALDNPILLDLENEITTGSGFDIVWYTAPEDGIQLNNSEELQEDTNYYAAGIDPVTGCESDGRLSISVILTECDPEQHDFFIPDGFSPNGDGRNDTYYIPDIEFFYPDYSLEILNRYGQSLFKGDRNNPGWDGRNNRSGSESTSGVYFFVLNYNKNNLQPKQGRLYLSK